MKSKLMLAVICSLTLPFALPAFADVLAYPAKGQSAEKQQKDQYDCFQWAKQQTGYDPHQVAGTVPPSSTPPKSGGAVRGAARGAAVGAVGGAIAGDAGKGAAIGAGVGGTGGAMRRRQEQAQAEQSQKAAQSDQQQKLTAFNDAQGMCLKGRGYSVK